MLLRDSFFCNPDMSCDPTNQCRIILFCTRPPSTTNFLVPCRCSSVHTSFVCLRSTARIVTLVLGCPSLPIDHPGLLQKHLFHVLKEDRSHVHPYTLLKDQSVPLRPLDASVMGFAHDRSCRSSNLSPCLHFEEMFLPCIMLFTLRPTKRGDG